MTEKENKTGQHTENVFFLFKYKRVCVVKALRALNMNQTV